MLCDDEPRRKGMGDRDEDEARHRRKGDDGADSRCFEVLERGREGPVAEYRVESAEEERRGVLRSTRQTPSTACD